MVIYSMRASYPITSGILLNNCWVNSTSVLSIHGPASVSTATAAIILGTKDSVASLSCVAAWKMLTTRPTPKSTAPATAVDHNDPHHDMLARARPIAVNLGPNARSFTWT